MGAVVEERRQRLRASEMTCPGSTKVSTGGHSPFRMQGHDVIKGLILGRDGAEGRAGHAVARCRRKDKLQRRVSRRGWVGTGTGGHPPSVCPTKHARLSTAGMPHIPPGFLAAGEVPIGGVAWRDGRGLGGAERVNRPPRPGAERGRASCGPGWSRKQLRARGASSLPPSVLLRSGGAQRGAGGRGRRGLAHGEG